MIPYLEINKRCILCDACRSICPEESILKVENKYSIDSWSCSRCFLCLEICPEKCIDLIEENLALSQSEEDSF